MQSQSFAELGVSRPVVAALAERGISEPLRHPALVVRDVLDGRDVLAKSPTGSGKTLAFAIPMIERIERRQPRPRRARARPDARARRPDRRAVPAARPRPRPRGRGRLRRRRLREADQGVQARRHPRRHAGPARGPDGAPRRASCAASRSSCSTRPTGCSTWASGPPSTGSSPSARRTARRCSSPPRSTARPGGSRREYTHDAVVREHVPEPIEAPAIEHRFVPTRARGEAVGARRRAQGATAA